VCALEVPDRKDASKKVLHDLVEDHLEHVLDCDDLCVFRGFPAGHGGEVDFLAFDREGKVFLIEVKRAEDQRGKYDVIFQVLKYHTFSNEILEELFSCDRGFEAKLARDFSLSGEDAHELAERVRDNIQKRLMNPVTIIDEASYQLIASAYCMALRGINAEFRVFEVNVQRIRCGGDAGTKDFLCVRRYRTDSPWVGNETKDNRRPTPRDSSLEATLGRIPDPIIGQKVRRLLERAGLRIRPAKSTKNFTLVKFKAYFTWDPSGAFTTGMPVPKLPKPKNPYRVVATAEDPEVVRRLTSAGFYPEKSENGTKTYCIFDLKSSTTDDDLDRLAAVLREL
jgi:hypothetical protein